MIWAGVHPAGESHRVPGFGSLTECRDRSSCGARRPVVRQMGEGVGYQEVAWRQNRVYSGWTQWRLYSPQATATSTRSASSSTP